MGAVLVVRTHPMCDKPALKAWVDQCVDTARFERGSSYSGDWNMAAAGLTFPVTEAFASTAAAEEYISENQDKWGPLMAVKAVSKRELPLDVARQDATLQALAQQLKELQNKLWNQPHEILARVRAGKSKLKGCSNCGSQISVAHLRGSNCPVCNHGFLATATDEKQRQALDTKITQLRAKVQAREDFLRKKVHKTTDTSDTLWVVGGWCAS